jgi:hypothetical protein
MNSLPTTKPLTITESARLAELESTIRQGLETFLAVGSALLEIREAKLYRAEFPTFEEYCTQRWGMKRAHAYRLMDAAQVAYNLSPMGDILPTSERQARPLTRLTPRLQREVWPIVVETAPDGKITAAHVEQVVRQAQSPDLRDPALEHARNLRALEQAAGGAATAEHVLEVMAEQALLTDVINRFNRVLDTASPDDLRQIQIWLEDFELDGQDVELERRNG